MQAMKCDRCGGYYNLTNDELDNFAIRIFRVNIQNKGADSKVVYHQGGQIDLCPKCFNELNEWFGDKKDEN